MKRKKVRNINLAKTKINNIMELAVKLELNTSSRKREKVYQRCYLMAKLRNLGCTYQSIGDIFNRDHAAVIHNIGTHKLFTKTSDIVYKVMVSPVAEMYENMNNNTEPNIIEDIMSCESLDELLTIKNKIEKGIYF